MKSSVTPNDIILGIDFGTTNSVISYFEKGPQVIKDGINSLIPTKVYLGEKKYFGNHIPKFIKGDNINLYENFKSKINEDGIDNKINNVIYLFFRYLKDLIIDAIFNSKKNQVSNELLETILTVPSNFNDIQRNIIINCARKAGFNVLRLINEPTAAAFAYGLDSNCDNDENILVIDIGGGTFDISLLEFDVSESGSYFEVVDSYGMNDLGGNNFTDCIYNNFCDLKTEEFRDTQLWKSCNKAKEKLSFLKKVDFKVDNDRTFVLDNNNCRDYCRDLLDRIKNSEWIINLLDKFKKKEIIIGKILMVGGSSKLIIIQDLIKELFGINPMIHNQIQHVVSLGACYYGALIKNKLNDFSDIILIDTLPLSLGVETADGNFSVIIPKNTPLPATRSKKYTTDTPGDEEVKICVYQGEKNVAKKNSLIGELTFDKVSMTTNPVINISFKVDISGLISVCIEDTKNNETKNILIKCNMEIEDDMIANQSIDDNFELEKLDEKEAQIMSLCYKIKNKIEILLSSNDNQKHLDDNKIEHFVKILESIENYDDFNQNNEKQLSIPELIKIEKELDEKYFLLINNSNLVINKNESIDSPCESKDYFDIEDIIRQEKLDNLISKIDFYLSKVESSGDNFKKDCLLDIHEKIRSKNNVSQKFIDDKLEYIKDLFSEDSKDELLNLCIFLKSGIDNKEIPDDSDLINYVNKNLDKINNNENENDSYYLEQINLINSICEKISKKI